MLPEGGKSLVIMICGVSGSGLKTAINALEDSGVYCIDNLPLEMISDAIVELEKDPGIWDRGIAFGVPIRKKEQVNKFFDLRRNIEKFFRCDIVFLTAENDIIELRYNANRRRHPLLCKGLKINEAINLEKAILSKIEKSADILIDTSHLSPHQLSRMIENRYCNEINTRNLYLMLISFGFKHGQCRPVDNLYDVRFLRNPYFNPDLKKETGLKEEVRSYVLEDNSAKEMLRRLEDWYRWILPLYYQEGKHFIRVAIGCTGGQHRSVTMVEELYKKLSLNPLDNIIISKSHRDIKVLSPL